MKWSAEEMGRAKKRLFMQICLDRTLGSDWSFAFDVNESEVTVFLRQLLREKRLMIAFPDQKAPRLEDAADRLVETLGDKLGTYIPGEHGLSEN